MWEIPPPPSSPPPPHLAIFFLKFMQFWAKIGAATQSFSPVERYWIFQFLSTVLYVTPYEGSFQNFSLAGVSVEDCVR